ncbi:MAG TPA: hypothetical protein VKP60_18040 [Magnetospirillaceae bacterium]|nr:hypothetical protein [Magnetospirillaceae bacterium]
MPNISEFSLSIGEMQLPLDITSIVHAQAGQLGIGAQPEFSFRFRWRETAFTVRCRSTREAARARITATLGVMPFSAESVQRRQFLTQILDGAVAHFGPIVTQTQGRILLDAELDLPAPITAVGLITGLTRFLVPMKPYLGLMAMVRMLPA